MELQARIAAFVLGETVMPEPALPRAARLLVDPLGVAGGAAGLEAGRIARECAVDLFGARSSDGRMLASGDVDARGGPEAPLTLAEIRRKPDGLAATELAPARSAAVWDGAGALLGEGSRFAELAALVAAPPDAGEAAG